MPAARFTHEDHLKPTYCPTCHARIPGVLKSEFGGLCHACAHSNRQDAKEILERQRLAKNAKREALKNHSTGLGECPECKSPNLSEIPKTAPNRMRAGLLWGAIGIGISAGACLLKFGEPLYPVDAALATTGIALFVTGLAQPPRRVLEKLLACNHCAHRWEVSARKSAVKPSSRSRRARVTQRHGGFA